MKILLVPYQYPNPYNEISANFCQKQAECLAKAGHEVSVLSVIHFTIPNIIKKRKLFFGKIIYNSNNVKTYLLLIPSIPKLLRINLWFLQKSGLLFFKYYLKKEKLPDIIHLHIFFAGNLAIQLSKKYNIPYIVTEHSSNFALNLVKGWQNKLAKNTFSNSKVNIAVSENLANLLSENYNIPFKVIPNVINTDFFAPNSIKKQSKVFTFINVANLKKVKNHSLLINSFCELYKNIKNIKLIIIGEGDEEKTLYQLSQTLNLTNVISFVKNANSSVVKKYLNEADCFVLSSNYETFGVSIVEALSCGLPVISTKCEGAESIITDPKIGLLSNSNVRDYSETMFYVYKNFEKYDSNYIRKFAIENYSYEAIAYKLTTIYESI